MKKLRNLLLILLTIIIILPLGVKAEGEKPEATKEPVNVYLFHGSTCPHCKEAIEWFDSIEEEYGDYFTLVTYEVWEDQENSKFMDNIAKFRKDNPTGVPYIIVGDYSYENGFGADSIIDQETGKTEGDRMIERILELYESDDRYDVIEAYNNRPDYSVVVGIVAFVIIAGVVGTTIIVRRNNED